MESAKPHKTDTKREPQPYQARTHTNAKFYTSVAWRGLRKQYIAKLEERQLIEAKGSDRMLYLIDMMPVCETCMKLFLAGAYTTVTKGKELDHIIPLNPDNALMDKNYGKPLDVDNLQFLCRRHHAKKSNRDKAYHNKLKTKKK